MRKTFKQAFTLAEVLIVLGIIGIVASMTIPTLMNTVAKQEYVTALKKFYSTQTDGWSRLLADEGVQQLDDTSVFQSMSTPACGISQANDAGCKPFFDTLKKYFRFTVVTAPRYNLYNLDGSQDPSNDYTDSIVLALADGSVMFTGTFSKDSNGTYFSTDEQIAAGGGNLYNEISEINIDVNGFKKPNTFGRDIFIFILSNNGKLYPYFGKDMSLFFDFSPWQEDSGLCGTAGSTDVSNVNGMGCAGRIMDEGWQMNY